MNDRNLFLDILRVVIIAAIVAVHITRDIFNGQIGNIVAVLFIGVAFLSGASNVLSTQRDSIGFAIKRITNIWIPFAAIFIIGYLVGSSLEQVIWFVVFITALSVMHPTLSGFMSRYTTLTIGASLVMFFVGLAIPGESILKALMIGVLPFVTGIYAMQTKSLPQTSHDNEILKSASKHSYMIFLVSMFICGFLL